MAKKDLTFDLLEYLAVSENGNGHIDPDRIPSLNDLSAEMGVSIASLREQLGVARALGLVEVRPRTGIRRLPYQFAPAVHESLSYAIALDRKHFDAYADLRKKTETAYWHQAVLELTPVDHQKLQDLLVAAEQKLAGHPIEIPHQEHRALHLTIFSRLNNPFVLGLLEAYWDAYEEVGLNLYEELDYHRRVWQYHRRIVDCIIRGDFDAGHTALIEHMELISGRPEKRGSGTNAKEKYS